MKTLIPILIALALASCVTQRRCNSKFPPSTDTQVRDSIIIRDSIIYKDRLVPYKIPGDTIWQDKPIPGIPEKINTAPMRLENTYAIAEAWIENSKLRLKLQQKDQVITFKLDSADRIAKHWEERYREASSVKVLPPEKYTPKFWLITGCMFIGLVLALIVYFVFKILKP